MFRSLLPWSLHAHRRSSRKRTSDYPKKSSRRALRMESLEERVVLATLFWQGDVDNDWSSVGNWADDLAGTDNGNTPANNDVLVFNTGTTGFTNFTSNNDVAGLTGIEIQVVDNSGSDDFTLGGAEAVQLSANGVSNSGTDVGTTTINTNLNLAAATSISAASGAPLDLAGVIGGSFGINLVGDGTVILSGANAYTGATSIQSGTL